MIMLDLKKLDYNSVWLIHLTGDEPMECIGFICAMYGFRYVLVREFGVLMHVLIKEPIIVRAD